MREYTILRWTTDGQAWKVVGTSTGVTPHNAIRAHCERVSDAATVDVQGPYLAQGRYLAIRTDGFKPLDVTVETQTTMLFGSQSVTAGLAAEQEVVTAFEEIAEPLEPDIEFAEDDFPYGAEDDLPFDDQNDDTDECEP